MIFAQRIERVTIGRLRMQLKTTIIRYFYGKDTAFSRISHTKNVLFIEKMPFFAEKTHFLRQRLGSFIILSYLCTVVFSRIALEIITKVNNLYFNPKSLHL
ncbi:MAG: hypothetical protein ACI397_00070 [Paludibacteraceae bacterium]